MARESRCYFLQPVLSLSEVSRRSHGHPPAQLLYAYVIGRVVGMLPDASDRRVTMRFPQTLSPLALGNNLYPVVFDS